MSMLSVICMNLNLLINSDVSERSSYGIANCYFQLITLFGRQIYNGCFRRYPSVIGILQVAEANQECKNANWYLP